MKENNLMIASTEYTHFPMWNCFLVMCHCSLYLWVSHPSPNPSSSLVENDVSTSKASLNMFNCYLYIICGLIFTFLPLQGELVEAARIIAC